MTGDMTMTQQRWSVADNTVRTGKYRPESQEGKTPPDRAYDYFADFVDDLL
jgi:hypothetical protein